MVRPPQNCKLKPKYADGDVVHPYCSKKCASSARSNRSATGNTSIPTRPFRSTSIMIHTDEETASGAGHIVDDFDGSGPANPRNRVTSTTQNNRPTAHRAKSP